MPGTSRHHWGTDIDLNAFTNTYFESGAGYKIYQWLLTNAASYGFCQPYTKKGVNRPSGYEEEKWHWSYLPISVALTQQAAQTLTDDQIKGFKGAEVAETIKVVQNYVLGIEPRCLNPKN
jgi:LAS superfamily LD-carboxypeptidase LdcB